jgi:hypothetical protein
MDYVEILIYENKEGKKELWKKVTLPLLMQNAIYNNAGEGIEPSNGQVMSLFV